MTCLSPTAAEDRLEHRAASTVERLLRHWRPFRAGRLAAWQDRREAAGLDDRSLRDLGLHRDLIERQDPRGRAAFWLSRPAL